MLMSSDRWLSFLEEYFDDLEDSPIQIKKLARRFIRYLREVLVIIGKRAADEDEEEEDFLSLSLRSWYHMKDIIEPLSKEKTEGVSLTR